MISSFPTFPGGWRLGYHLKARQIVRIPWDSVPVGCVRIVAFNRHKFPGLKVDDKYGELDQRWWGFERWFNYEDNYPFAKEYRPQRDIHPQLGGQSKWLKSTGGFDE